MPLGMTIWLTCCGLIGLLWASRHFALSQARRNNPRVSTDDVPDAGSPTPRLSILVAAKDEEATIGTCVRTLLEQDYADGEVIAVNDRSSDRTGAILDELRSAFPDRLKVVHVQTLPEGWFGKNNAMRRGVEIATGEWFCFVDADCRQLTPRTMSAAMGFVQARAIDFLSIMPALETRSFWEKVIQPVCAAILVIWFNPRRVNDPASSAAYANGAFMLMNRATYDVIGGHHAVRTELNEDIHMARLAKHAGRRLMVAENGDLYVTRMYDSFRACWRGWSRIFFGCFGTLRRLVMTLGLVCVGSVFPCVSLLVAVLGWTLAGDASADHWGWAVLVTGTVFVLLESVIYRFIRLTGAADWAWLTYPLGVMLGVGMLLNAMAKIGGATTTTWRGTTYRGDQRETGSGDAALPTGDAAAQPQADVA